MVVHEENISRHYEVVTPNVILAPEQSVGEIHPVRSTKVIVNKWAEKPTVADQGKRGK